jgi:hypothetical protein
MSAQYLSSLPLWLSVIVIVVLPTIIAMVVPFVLHRWIGHQQLASNNEIAGFKFATVGVIYAVMLAFAVIVVWEKFSLAETTVIDEAGAAATVYRLAGGADVDMTKMRDAMRTYLHAAVEKDWPSMQRGKGNPETRQALDALYAAAVAVAHDQPLHPAVAEQLFEQLDTITQSRRSRLHLSAGIVPSIIWIVLYVGAVLTVSFTFFFGTKNVRAQVLMTGILSCITFMGLLTIISIDFPFSGPTSVGSEPLQAVLEDFYDK